MVRMGMKVCMRNSIVLVKSCRETCGAEGVLAWWKKRSLLGPSAEKNFESSSITKSSDSNSSTAFVLASPKLKMSRVLTNDTPAPLTNCSSFVGAMLFGPLLESCLAEPIESKVIPLRELTLSILRDRFTQILSSPPQSPAPSSSM